MKTHRFKTTIQCGGCIEKVTPFLNELVPREAWNVDTSGPDRVLTVRSDTVRAEDIEEKVRQAGYGIERLRG